MMSTEKEPTIPEIRSIWTKFEHNRCFGASNEIAQTSTEDLKLLAEKLQQLIDATSCFPEAETTRYWACLKENQVAQILRARGEDG